MLGRSSTAVITFDGPILPKQVLYYGGEMWCYPYRPTRQVCYACGQQGHRMDVCPNPETRTCRQCGCQNPEEVHQCTPKCLLCGGDHAVGTRDCKQRLKSASELRWGTQQQLRRSRSRCRGRRPRWFRDESQGPGWSGSRSRSRGRSRSRSRSRGSVRDESYPPLGNTDKKQLQQKQQQKKSGEGVKVP
ncbi:serine/arginine-rich splicing factor 6-like [Dermacentor albipictus]|uniref:serine/arginine-rich splicing factor 6-like n=1 Tax=Dermacentor albipictus TaxID=60249 RepID=UPI0038FBFEB3